MKSLYDVLGARMDDDAQAIRKAFRAAVKAYHPDLHPGDPDAVLRFRRIITAAAILRDKKQRAAYDQRLGLDREQIRQKFDQRLLRLQYQRRQTRLKVGAIAAVAVVALAGGYGLLMPKPTTAVVAVMKDTPSTAMTATIVETIRKDSKVKTLTVASLATAGVGESTPAAVTATMDSAGNGADNAPGSARDASAHVMPAHLKPAHKEETDATPAVPEGSGAMAHAGAAAAAGADIPDGVLKRGAALSATDRSDKGSDASALADREPTTALPNDAHLYQEMGTASYRIGDFPHAIVSLDEAIRLDPNDATAYDIRGNAWDEIGDFGNALADYDAAIRIDPKNPVFFHDRAVMWHRQGNLDKALADLDRAIRFTFSDPNIYCDRGLVWYEKGSPARAVADFNHASKIDPDFVAACISRGLILHRNGEFNVRFAELGRTIRVSPDVYDVSRHVASHP
jgi:tetratricopeptide (TPR) repeat protein